MINSSASLHWFALRVKSRHEKITAFALHNKGYEEFLPCYCSPRHWSDRTKQLELPLFPGYIFCRFHAGARLPILTSPGVVQIVGIGKEPVPIEESEIEAIQAILRSGLPAIPWPGLQVGQRVRVDRGPLCDVEGTLVEFKKHHRLIVSVTLLQRSVAVEIDRRWITPLHPSGSGSSASFLAASG